VLSEAYINNTSTEQILTLLAMLLNKLLPSGVGSRTVTSATTTGTTDSSIITGGFSICTAGVGEGKGTGSGSGVGSGIGASLILSASRWAAAALRKKKRKNQHKTNMKYIIPLFLSRRQQKWEN